MLAGGGISCGRKQEYLEQLTHVSIRATTIPFNIQPLLIMGIEFGSRGDKQLHCPLRYLDTLVCIMLEQYCTLACCRAVSGVSSSL